jgi:diguanylate cyclase (GGDEF)-like protein/PAS domain S-box-containing protein
MIRNSEAAKELLRRAETVKDSQASSVSFIESAEDPKRLLHELSVYQIELEAQNEELRIAREALNESLALATELYDSAPTPYFTLASDGKMKRVNLAGGTLLGMERSRLPGRNFDSFLDDRSRDGFNTLLRDLFISQSRRTLSADGTVSNQARKAIHMNLSLSPDGQECRVMAIDVTERKRTETALAHSNSLLNTLLQTIPFPMDIVDATGRILFRNGVMEKAAGTRSLEGRCWEVYKDDGKKCLRCPLHEPIQIGRKIVMEVDGVLGGKIFEVHHTGMLYAGQPALLEVFLDITDRELAARERKASEATIWNQANYDSLTGLPNRNLFHDRLELAIKNLRNKDASLAILVIDIDNFKSINDSLGHSAGDLLLIEAAQRIHRRVRAGDTVARLGGDEFIAILPVLDDRLRLEQIVEAIHNEISYPFDLNGQVVYATASIGITQCPEDGADVETLLKNAEQAMYAAKAKGRNRYNFFTAEMQQEAQAHLRLSRDLHLGVQANQFVAYYQPIIDLTSNRCVKAEALVRWRHPHRGVVLPGEFIPLAEQNGLIGEIGYKMLKDSAEQLKLWAGMEVECQQVCVNRSPREFILGKNHRRWLDFILESGLPPGSFNVEITEGHLLDAYEGITEKLLRYGEVGVQVSIDDFGTGYSAMSYLHKYHVDYLKIDKSFVAEMTTNSSDRAIVEAIIAMAHKLSMKVVAEGVETVEQRDLLIAAGCDLGQGYLFARPMPAGEFRDYLARTGSTA